MDHLIKPIVAIHQPNYIPWLGYFLKMASCDHFVYHDNVSLNIKSYTRRAFIKGKHDIIRLTIPLQGVSQHTLIKDAKIDHSNDWMSKHLKTIKHCYSKSPYFNPVFTLLETLFSELSTEQSLANFNIHCIETIARYIGIQSETIRSSTLPETLASNTDLYHINLIKSISGNSYISGIGAKAYQSVSYYEEHAVPIAYLDSSKLLNTLFPFKEIEWSVVHLLMYYTPDYIKTSIASIKG